MNNTKNMYCRLCAELKSHIELTNLQTDEETCQKVVNKLSRFNIVMDFQENILPKTVCLLCVKYLEQAFTFVTAVEQAQAFLSEFNLVQKRSVKNDSYGETTFYAPSDVSEKDFDVNVENTCDPMDVNDNDDEELDNEDFSNDHNDDGNNLGTENVHTDIKDTRQYSDVIVEDKIGVKDETDDHTDINNVKNIKENESPNFSNNCTETQYTNVGENDLNIKDTKLPCALEEKLRKDILITELNSEPIAPLNNSVYSTDYINNQDDSTIDTKSVSSGEPHKWIQPHSKPIQPKQFDTTVYTEDFINKQMNRLSIIPVQYLKKTWLDYEWKCSHCGTLFSNIGELQKHSMVYHKICNAYQCIDCKIRKQRLNAFIKHVRSHRRYLHYSCYKCFEKFPTTMEAIHHKTKIHENSKHICIGCNTPFFSNTELEEHFNKYYNILCKKNTSINSDNLTCSICNKVYANFASLRNHVKRHKEKKRDHVCDRCGKCFDSEPSLKTHMDMHIEKILYQCEICKTTFTNVRSLGYHASIHSGIKPFTCDVCSKCFRTKKQIKSHMKVHMDYVPITCTVCNKKFRMETYLQNHMLQHTGEKPFSCDICPRDFTNRPNRNKHMRRRHGIEMGKKRQPIIKRQTAHDPISSDLATRETKFANLDKMNGKAKLRNNEKVKGQTKSLKKESD